MLGTIFVMRLFRFQLKSPIVTIRQYIEIWRDSRRRKWPAVLLWNEESGVLTEKVFFKYHIFVRVGINKVKDYCIEDSCF